MKLGELIERLKVLHDVCGGDVPVVFTEQGSGVGFSCEEAFIVQMGDGSHGAVFALLVEHDQS